MITVFQGENVLMDVMRALQRRHAEMITEEFQPAIGKDMPLTISSYKSRSSIY